MTKKMVDKASDKACGMEMKKDGPLPKKAKKVYGESAKTQTKAK